MDAKLKMFKANNTEQYAKYIDANPTAVAVVSIYNGSVTPLNNMPKICDRNLQNKQPKIYDYTQDIWTWFGEV